MRSRPTIGPPWTRIVERYPRLAGPTRHALLILLVVLITALAWPFVEHPAAPGLDRSWQIALHMAAWMNLRHGVDFVFTFGPLGFLSVPQPYLGMTSLLALIAAGAIYVALVWVLLIEARRVVPLWAAALLVLAIARTFVLLPPFEAFQILVFVACVEALAGRIRLPPTTIVVALGVATGFAAMGKLNVGIFVGAMSAVTALTIDPRWWRELALYAAAAAATGLGLWIATGQSIADLVPFALGAIQIVNGYTETMGLDRDVLFLWIYPAFVGVAVLFGWTAYRISAHWPRRSRLGLLLLCLILGFALWKIAFIRGYSWYVFASLLVGLAALGTTLGDRRQWLTSLLVVAIPFLATAGLPPVSYVDVAASARSLVSETVTAAIPSKARRAEKQTRATLRERYAIDPVTLAELAGRRVSIDPFEAGVAFAYPELTWAPLPIFQSYFAFTPALDRRNAERLASANAPERILRTLTFTADPPDWLTRQRGHPLRPGESIPFTVDGRYQWFEAPAAVLETFCRYHEISAIGKWQVLAPTGGSCGPPEPMATVHAREGDQVTIPVENRPDRFVIVRIHGMEPSLLGRIRSVLHKPVEWYITIADVRYRLVVPTAGDGLLLAVPPGADGSTAFEFGPAIESISVKSRQDGSNRRLTYEFESVPLIHP